MALITIVPSLRSLGGSQLWRCLCTLYKVLYDQLMTDQKPVTFRGSALDDLRAFPETARRAAGYQLGKLQNGLDPNDWKPMPTIGQGVSEIRVRDASGAFRIIYVAKLPEAVYLLHCFQKKTQKTARADLELAAKRYQELLKERGR